MFNDCLYQYWDDSQTCSSTYCFLCVLQDLQSRPRLLLSLPFVADLHLASSRWTHDAPLGSWHAQKGTHYSRWNSWIDASSGTPCIGGHPSRPDSKPDDPRSISCPGWLPGDVSPQDLTSWNVPKRAWLSHGLRGCHLRRAPPDVKYPWTYRQLWHIDWS